MEEIINREKQRSKLQNSSLHIFCRVLAQELSDAGISMRVLLENFEIDPTENSIKDIFRQIGKQKFGKTSTAKLSTKEVMEVYEEINREVSKKGIFLPWPSQESFREFN